VTLDDERAPDADAAERERARRQRIASMRRLVGAAVGVACVALLGSYLVPGGGLRFGAEPERAEGWEAIPWDACGSVRSFGELAEADLDDEALCAALLKARSHSGGDDEFFVLTGEVEARKVREALAAERRVAEPSAPPHDDLQLLLVRSPGNRFSQRLPHAGSDREDRVDTLAIWFPEDEEPDEVQTVPLSSESDSYPALERLISH
jgi:hypothetical protein